MKETIYTIPITEAFEAETKAGGGKCPVCRLHTALERSSLDYILGGAMMEPDVRTETNKKGFCARHYARMLRAQKKLSLALILQSHLNESKKHIKERLSQPESCFLCDRVRNSLERYYNNILYLWSTSPEFRALYNAAPCVCVRHGAGLYAVSAALSKKDAAAFREELEQRFADSLDRLGASVDRFCSSFDYRNAGMELGGDKIAVENAIAALTGDGSI